MPFAATFPTPAPSPIKNPALDPSGSFYSNLIFAYTMASSCSPDSKLASMTSSIIRSMVTFGGLTAASVADSTTGSGCTLPYVSSAGEYS